MDFRLFTLIKVIKFKKVLRDRLLDFDFSQMELTVRWNLSSLSLSLYLSDLACMILTFIDCSAVFFDGNPKSFSLCGLARCSEVCRVCLACSHSLITIIVITKCH